MAAKITGRVTGVFFDEGMHVKEGQILATLDDSDVKRALESAVADRNSTRAQITDLEVQLKNAEIEMHRAKALLNCRRAEPGSARQREHTGGQPESQNRADQSAGGRLRKRASPKRSKPWTIA